MQSMADQNNFSDFDKDTAISNIKKQTHCRLGGFEPSGEADS